MRVSGNGCCVACWASLLVGHAAAAIESSRRVPEISSAAATWPKGTTWRLRTSSFGACCRCGRCGGSVTGLFEAEHCAALHGRTDEFADTFEKVRIRANHFPIALARDALHIQAITMECLLPLGFLRRFYRHLTLDRLLPRSSLPKTVLRSRVFRRRVNSP